MILVIGCGFYGWYYLLTTPYVVLKLGGKLIVNGSCKVVVFSSLTTRYVRMYVSI